VSVAVTAVVAVLTLMGSPVRVVRSSSKGEETIASTTRDATACQSDEVLPAGVTAIRMALEAEFGPKVAVRVYSGSRLLTQGTAPPGWTATAVTVPVRPLSRTVSHVKLCFTAGPNSEHMQLYGVPARPPRAAVVGTGQPLRGRFSVEYLRSGSGTWFSDALTIARHMGIGHALAGSWLALLAAALVAAVAALTIRLAWRELP
jgi:hypothetical protein